MTWYYTACSSYQSALLFPRRSGHGGRQNDGVALHREIVPVLAPNRANRVDRDHLIRDADRRLLGTLEGNLLEQVAAGLSVLVLVRRLVGGNGNVYNPA